MKLNATLGMICAFFVLVLMLFAQKGMRLITLVINVSHDKRCTSLPGQKIILVRDLVNFFFLLLLTSAASTCKHHSQNHIQALILDQQVLKAFKTSRSYATEGLQFAEGEDE